jgi:hypothetical protein
MPALIALIKVNANSVLARIERETMKSVVARRVAVAISTVSAAVNATT